ncbi:MAG: amino acid ABC transporter permease [Rhodobacteraceae bacterium]|nr:amino acid ABC transporter permease [Paracoccaceae bacterium]
MKYLARMRPSNLVILAATPFIIWLFATVPNYQRSLVAIVGVEPGAGRMFIDFLIMLAVLLALVMFALRYLLPGKRGQRGVLPYLVAAVAAVAAAFLISRGVISIASLVNVIVANAVDPALSDLVVKALTPRQLSPEGAAIVEAATLGYMNWFALANLVLVAALGAVHLGKAARGIGKVIAIAILVLDGGLLAYLLLNAHLGFAAGLFTTIRAGIFAYMLAATLGICWAGMLHISPGPKTTRRYAVAAALMLAAAVALFLQPHSKYVLAGSLDKKVAIAKGTPKPMIDAIRYGGFDGAPADREIGLRSVLDDDHAFRLLQEGDQVSAVFVPEDKAPAGAPVIWKVTFLPDYLSTPANTLLILGILLGLLTISAHQHGRHPLSVGTEFFVDTVRGVPMLVIILFIGLPLAGALKDATGGAINPSNVVRGVFAIAIAYSAYMAEIFRAGIDAVPRTQSEAARSLGLNNWQLARLIVLPQALKIVIPPLGNEFIAMLKDTSLLSILSVRDVTQRMREFQSASFLPFAPFNSAAILYVFLTLAAASLISHLERKYDVGKH